MPLKTQPDPKEWAKVIGISVDYELPENFVDAKIAVDETGNNILFLCVGFFRVE